MIFPWNIFQFTDVKMLHVYGKAMWYWNRYLHACVKEGQAFQRTLVEHIGFLEGELYPTDKRMVH